MEKRSPEWLRQAAIARGCGLAGRSGLMTDWKGGRLGTRKGKVTGLYPYIFTCEVGGFTEYFRYNQLVGRETGERVMLGG